MAWLRAPANQISYALRSTLRWSRGVKALDGEDKDALFQHLDGALREQAEREEARLCRRYDLAALREHSQALDYADNLSLLRTLEQLACSLPLPVRDDTLRALDIGSGDFHYATALHRWLRWHAADRPRTVELRGLEVDGHGIYRDGHARVDHGRAHAALAGPCVRYEVADAARLRERGTVDVVSLFYPFMLPYPLLRWGLPLHHYKPRRLLAAAVAALRPGGLLVVTNQTPTEYCRLCLLLQRLPVERLRQQGIADSFVPFAERTEGRQGSIWRRL